jgi:sterol desaturase/sphingolipid hydroxylase (fatty acid hydroxylase superfamily)
MLNISDILEYKGWIVCGVFLLLFVYEHLRPAATPSLHPVWRILKNLSFWPVNIGLSLAVILPVTYFAAEHALWNRPDNMPAGLMLAIDILILDLFIYWWHKAVHEIQFFWRFHEVHHLDEHLDTTSAIRFHFGEIFFSSIVRAIVIMLFGIPFTSVILFEILVLSFTLFHHSNIALPKRLEAVISYIVVTPSIHWVHHHAIRKDTDSNYGTIFSFWDRAFKSRSTTRRSIDMKIGVENRKDKAFLKLLILPFRYRKK